MAATRQDSDGVHDSRPGSASSRRMASAWPGGRGFPFFFRGNKWIFSWFLLLTVQRMFKFFSLGLTLMFFSDGKDLISTDFA